MQRTAAMVSSALRRIVPATAAVRHQLLNPVMSTVAAIPRRPNLAVQLIIPAPDFFFPALIHTRGYAHGRGASSPGNGGDDFSEEDMDSEDIEFDEKDFCNAEDGEDDESEVDEEDQSE